MGIRVRLALGTALLLGCGQNNAALTPDASLQPDAQDSDSSSDASDEGGDLDAATEAETGPPATYNDPTNAGNWSTFSAGALFDGGTGTPLAGYSGAVFDKRYIYYVPLTNGTATTGHVLRYDTTASWANGTSWADFNTQTINPSANGFFGGVFDGRYVYLTPMMQGYSGPPNATFVRYDTTAAFGSGASWSVYDGSGKTVGGYAGAVFDGKYVYFSPYYKGHVVMRYDTSVPFGSGAAWSTFDVSTKYANAGYFGAAFDGQYIYFAPNDNAQGSVFLRYDTTASFASGSSWTTYDLTLVNPASKGFSGVVCDGRYVYLVPCNGGSPGGHVLTRFDSQGSFTDKAAYSTYDLFQLHADAWGFFGGIFDGRYLHLMPGNKGRMVRYDTTGSFTTTGSYQSFDMTQIPADATNPEFWGGAFDGEFVYFAPFDNVPFTRFDAKTPPSMPAVYHGSFF